MSGRRVWLGLLLTAAVFAAAYPPATAAYPPRTPRPLAAVAAATDVAVGVPHWNRGVGAVDAVRWNGGRSLLTTASLGLGPGVAGDRFGAALAVQDLNGDGYRDLVVGAPGRGGTGAAYLVLGGADGRSAGVRALPFPALPGDDFGAAVAMTFADAAMWVYVGAPGRNVSGRADAGAFVQYRIGPADDGGVSIRVLATVTQDSPLIPDAAETGDRFGEVLAPGRGVVVGTPLEDVGRAVDAGIVTDIAFGEGQLYSQDTRGIPGAAESGDHFGSAIAGEYVGVPGEDLGRIRDAGMVQRWNPVNPRRDIAAFSQSTPGVPGASEPGDRFGASLAAGSISAPFALDLVVGAPGEDVGSAADAGVVTVVSATPGGPADTMRQGDDLPGAPEAGDRLGASLEGLLIGAPGEDLGDVRDAGVLHVARPLSPLPRVVTLSTGPTAGARFGSVTDSVFTPGS